VASVWLVGYSYDYEGGDIVGVYATRELAEKAQIDAKSEYRYANVSCWEEEVHE